MCLAVSKAIIDLVFLETTIRKSAALLCVNCISTRQYSNAWMRKFLAVIFHRRTAFSNLKLLIQPHIMVQN